MRDFGDMTADEIAAYRGPVYRATVRAVRKGVSGPKEQEQRHDFESTTHAGLYGKVTLLAKDWHILTYTEGPHTQPEELPQP